MNNRLKSWFTDTITVAPMTGADSYGQPTYGDQQAISCRVEEKLQKIVNAEGQEVMSDHEIALLDKVGLQDRIWLPGADTEKPDQARTAHNRHFARGKRGDGFYMLYL